MRSEVVQTWFTTPHLNDSVTQYSVYDGEMRSTVAGRSRSDVAEVRGCQAT